MEHALAPLFTVSQATFFGLGLVLIAPLLWVPISRWGKEPRARTRTAWLLFLTVPWVLLAYWTSFNWHVDGAPTRAPAAAEPLAYATLGSTFILSAISVLFNRGARWFFTGWGAVNTWFSAMGAFLCLMATSGVWI